MNNVRLFGVAIFSALGAFLFGMDIGYIASILESPSFKRDVAHLAEWSNAEVHISNGAAGFIVAIFSIGCVLTSFPPCSAYFLDAWGRKYSIMIGAFVFVVAAALQASSNSIDQFLFGRLVSGFSIGLLSTVVSLYQSEVAPAYMRGSLTSCYQLMICLGILVAALLNELWDGVDGGWRIVIWIQVFPGAFLLLAMPFLPDSPRWLVQQGRREEALESMLLLQSYDEASAELEEIEADHKLAESVGVASWSEIFRGRVLKLLTLGVSLQMLQQLVGMNAFMYFGPRIYMFVGVNPNFYQFLCVSVNFVATFLAVMFADDFGRRLLLVWSALGMTIACLCMGFLGYAYQSLDQGHRELVGYGLVCSIFTFVANFAYGWGPIVWVYNAEIFPMRVRSRCVAATACSNWVGNFIVAQMTPILLGRWAFDTFYVFATFSTMSLIVALWIPETKGVGLEQIHKLFDYKFGDESEEAKVAVSLESYGAAKA